jgi:hypothetical protein
MRIVLLCLLVCGCSHSGGDPDGSIPDAHDAGGDDAKPDEDIGDSFAVSIPTGAQVCTMCGGRDAKLEYQLKGRITFRPGLYRLPPGENFVEAEIIDSVELGPDRLPAESQGPGTFNRKQEGQEYHYEYVQSFIAGGQPFEIRMTAIFGDQVLTLDNETLTLDAWNPWNRETAPRFQLEASWGDGTEPHNQLQKYATCNHDSYSLVTVNVEIDSSDTLVIDSRSPPPMPIAGGGICPCPVFRAQFTSGAEQRDVQDHFRMLFTSGGMHCWYTAYLVVFDNPVGPVHALLMEGYIDPYAEVHYLDANLEVLRSPPITRIEWIRE